MSASTFENPSPPPDFDFILEHYVGGGGLWQLQRIISLYPLHIAMGIPLLLHLFTAYTPSHRCFVEGCDSYGNRSSYEADYLNFTIPTDHTASNFLSLQDKHAQCIDFDRVKPWNPSGPQNQCVPEYFSPTSQSNCSSGYVYDKSEFESTLTTDFDLVCDQDHLRRLLGTVMMLGLTFGSIIGGPLSDKLGRKTTTFFALSIVIPCLFAGAFVNSFASYVIFRLINCTVIVFGWISMHSLTIEYFSRSNRRLAFGVGTIMGTLAGLTLPFIAYYNRTWEWMHIWSGIVACFSLPIFFFIPESPRWLINHNKVDKAEVVLHGIARGNGKVFSEEKKKEMRQILDKLSKDCHDANTKGFNFLDMFRRNQTTKTLILMSAWICSIVTYYCLALNVQDLAGDIFVNFIISSLIDLPAHLFVIFFLDKFGRRKIMVGMLVLLGVSCLIMAAVPKDQTKLVLILYLCGKFSSSAGATICWLFTSELYPTNLRSQAIGACSCVSRIFGMSSPFIAKLSVFWKPLPMVALGIPTILSGFACFKLPETTGVKLPDTLEETVELALKSNVKRYDRMYDLDD